MKSINFILLAIVISWGEISAFTLQKFDITSKNTDGLTSEVNPTTTAKSTGNLMPSTSGTDKIFKVTNTSPSTNNGKAPLKSTSKNGEAPLKKRFRRSYGYKTQCIPVLKTKCRVFRVNNIEKNFCIKCTDYICTALD